MPKPFFVEYVFYAQNHSAVIKNAPTTADFDLDGDVDVFQFPDPGDARLLTERRADATSGPRARIQCARFSFPPGRGNLKA